MKIVRMKNTYNHEYGVICPDGRMHAWCESERQAARDWYLSVSMFIDCEIVKLVHSVDALNNFPDVCGIYVTEGE